jgi:hypothetical protein
MAKVTLFSELAITFFFEFENRLYFKVEISRTAKRQMIETTEYFAEAYQLCWPIGQMAMPFGDTVDTRFRQSWLYLEDFPHFSGVSVDSVRTSVEHALSEYAHADLSKFDSVCKRAQPQN